ncbi:MAG TPA: hypothetical protein VFM60_05340 [Salinimicrobium sp.]|nr:hypothetical protein [Salinimicrobium sp.]
MAGTIHGQKLTINMSYRKKPKKRPPSEKGKPPVGKITRKEKVLGILALTGLLLAAIIMLLLYLFLQLN